jgi:hypothetical protein
MKTSVAQPPCIYSRFRARVLIRSYFHVAAYYESKQVWLSLLVYTVVSVHEVSQKNMRIVKIACGLEVQQYILDEGNQSFVRVIFLVSVSRMRSVADVVFKSPIVRYCCGVSQEGQFISILKSRFDILMVFHFLRRQNGFKMALRWSKMSPECTALEPSVQLHFVLYVMLSARPRAKCAIAPWICLAQLTRHGKLRVAMFLLMRNAFILSLRVCVVASRARSCMSGLSSFAV